MDSTAKRLQIGSKNDLQRVGAPIWQGPFGFIVGALFWSYKILVGPALHVIGGVGFGCRFYPSCSLYARQSIINFGLLRGGFFAIRRFLACNPWNCNCGYDPVPEKSKRSI